ncbi:u-box domain-containing protein [Anaeramoeba flamelloides]|uniref:U-box domain-containing protein n=1 Tax=Anaeramoeba flamelloides TaxID=1746091 RepID=A0AAV7ZJ81_9EUKA|nr:u-box domain-containing protein [Anaeramoeba flamelloides]
MLKFHLIANIGESKIHVPIHNISTMRVCGLIKELNFRNVFLNQKIVGVKTSQDVWLFEQDFVKDILECGEVVNGVLENDLEATKETKKKKRSNSLNSEKVQILSNSKHKLDDHNPNFDQNSKTKQIMIKDEGSEANTEGPSFSYSYDSRKENVNFEKQKIPFKNSKKIKQENIFNNHLKKVNLIEKRIKLNQNRAPKEEEDKKEQEQEQEQKKKKNIKDEKVNREQPNEETNTVFLKDLEQDLKVKSKQRKKQTKEFKNNGKLHPKNLFNSDLSEDRTIYDEDEFSEGNEDENNHFVFSDFDRKLDENPEKLEKNMNILNEEITALKHDIKKLANISPPNTIKKESKHLQAPTELCCPLTRKIFFEPVISPYGNTFEYNAIKKFLDHNNDICPLTKKPLTIEQLIPSITIKKLCDEYRTQNKLLVYSQDKKNKNSNGKLNSNKQKARLNSAKKQILGANTNTNKNEQIKKYSILGLDTYHLFQIPMTIQIIKKSLHLSIYGGETLIEKIHQITYQKNLTSEKNILQLLFLTKKIWIKFPNNEQIEEFITDFELIKKRKSKNSKKKNEIFLIHLITKKGDFIGDAKIILGDNKIKLIDPKNEVLKSDLNQIQYYPKKNYSPLLVINDKAYKFVFQESKDYNKFNLLYKINYNKAKGNSSDSLKTHSNSSKHTSNDINKNHIKKREENKDNERAKRKFFSYFTDKPDGEYYQIVVLTPKNRKEKKKTRIRIAEDEIEFEYLQGKRIKDKLINVIFKPHLRSKRAGTLRFLHYSQEFKLLFTNEEKMKRFSNHFTRHSKKYFKKMKKQKNSKDLKITNKIELSNRHSNNVMQNNKNHGAIGNTENKNRIKEVIEEHYNEHSSTNKTQGSKMEEQDEELSEVAQREEKIKHGLISVKVVNTDFEILDKGEIIFYKNHVKFKFMKYEIYSHISKIKHFRHKTQNKLAKIEINQQSFFLLFETKTMINSFFDIIEKDNEDIISPDSFKVHKKNLSTKKFEMKILIFKNKKKNQSKKNNNNNNIANNLHRSIENPIKGILNINHGKGAIKIENNQTIKKFNLNHVKMICDNDEHLFVTLHFQKGKKPISFLVSSYKNLDKLASVIPRKRAIKGDKFYGTVHSSNMKKFSEFAPIKISFQSPCIKFELTHSTKNIQKTINIQKKSKTFQCLCTRRNRSLILFKLSRKNYLTIDIQSNFIIKSINTRVQGIIEAKSSKC